ncbi:cytochrome c oxidase subunit 8A, mitochondrial, partial [Corvus hawaiiensis]|uniref:cytochrome c oxidase subunit 8A, mitochondrial n=1 Tax=Corvus hawaiiensis TaxID=134902 RepID=UPI0020195CC7
GGVAWGGYVNEGAWSGNGSVFTERAGSDVTAAPPPPCRPPLSPPAPSCAPRSGPARPRAASSRGPPQHPLGLAESAVGFVAMFVSFLGPAAWVLAHFDDYKKRE